MDEYAQRIGSSTIKSVVNSVGKTNMMQNKGHDEIKREVFSTADGFNDVELGRNDAKHIDECAAAFTYLYFSLFKSLNEFQMRNISKQMINDLNASHQKNSRAQSKNSIFQISRT